MNTELKPFNRWPALLNEWLRPDQMFNGDFFEKEFSPMRLGVNVPSVNVKENAKEFTLEMAAPGLDRKDFNIEIKDDTLTISAEREEEKEEKKDEGYSRREYSYNSFCRSFSLPDNVKEGDVDAKYENGVLTIHIPKSEETPVLKAKSIAVK